MPPFLGWGFAGCFRHEIDQLVDASCQPDAKRLMLKASASQSEIVRQTQTLQLLLPMQGSATHPRTPRAEAFSRTGIALLNRHNLIL